VQFKKKQPLSAFFAGAESAAEKLPKLPVNPPNADAPSPFSMPAAPLSFRLQPSEVAMLPTKEQQQSPQHQSVGRRKGKNQERAA
jgi:hypothetical protein